MSKNCMYMYCACACMSILYLLIFVKIYYVSGNWQHLTSLSSDEWRVTTDDEKMLSSEFKKKFDGWMGVLLFNTSSLFDICWLIIEWKSDQARSWWKWYVIDTSKVLHEIHSLLMTSSNYTDYRSTLLSLLNAINYSFIYRKFSNQNGWFN